MALTQAVKQVFALTDAFGTHNKTVSHNAAQVTVMVRSAESCVFVLGKFNEALATITIPKAESTHASGSVTILLAAGAGEVMVVVFVVHNTNWLVVAEIIICERNVFIPAKI